jgi:Protein of unknown function (DUF3754)
MRGRTRPSRGRRITQPFHLFPFQDLKRRNIHIRRYQDIPMADTELIFPDKNIYLKPFTIITMIITIVGGIAAAASAISGVSKHPCEAVM